MPPPRPPQTEISPCPACQDIRGDSLTLMLLSLSTLIYFSTFDSPLLRSELDGAEGEVA